MLLITIYLIILLVFAAIFTREVIAPASQATCDRRWQIQAGVLNMTQAAAALGAGYVFESLFHDISIFKLADQVNFVAGGFLVFLVASFIAYWWHRATHRSDLLWRIFHQLHHSPHRIEAHTAFYAHPLDSIAATFISCFTSYFLLGLDYRSTAIALLLVSLFNLYIHSDTKSPRWIGYFIQRPEMHRVHHQRDHHANNYGLPLWDLLFGTWADPEHYVEECGFSADKEAQIFEMLKGKDVHA